MPQSLSQVILHIIFSTKERRPWLDPAIRPQMHAYLATLPCIDGTCLQANGLLYTSPGHPPWVAGAV